MKIARIAAIAVIMVLAVSAAAMAGGALQVMTRDGAAYLTDGSGMTLYYITTDKGAKGAGCSGPCLDKWPIYYQEKPEVAAGLMADDFSVITRADGKRQTTFRGWPLYYFVGDKAPGDTNGDGLKNVWHVVTPAKIQPYF